MLRKLTLKVSVWQFLTNCNSSRIFFKVPLSMLIFDQKLAFYVKPTIFEIPHRTDIIVCMQHQNDPFVKYNLNISLNTNTNWYHIWLKIYMISNQLALNPSSQLRFHYPTHNTKASCSFLHNHFLQRILIKDSMVY